MSDEALAAAVTPPARALFHTDGLLRPRGVVGRAYRVFALRLVTVNADKMAPEIVLSTERTATGAMGADVGLQSVGVVRRHVCFKVVSASEGYWYER